MKNAEEVEIVTRSEGMNFSLSSPLTPYALSPWWVGARIQSIPPRCSGLVVRGIGVVGVQGWIREDFCG